LFASGYIHDARDSYQLSLHSPDFYTTIGIHPCRANEPFLDLPRDADYSTKQEALSKYFKEMEDIIENCEHKDKFIAIGECGLDYDRFEYADKDT
jgi:TatD DNase family protein